MSPRTAVNPFLSLAFMVFLAGCAQPGPSSSVAKGSVESAQYPNLFAQAGHAPDEIARKIEATFQQMFHGDPTEHAVYYPAGSNEHGPLAYILDVNNNDVRSEGMSYGMMIA